MCSRLLSKQPLSETPVQNRTLLGWRWLAPLHCKPLSGAQSTPPPTHTHHHRPTREPANGVTFPQLALCSAQPCGSISSACNFQPP